VVGQSPTLANYIEILSQNQYLTFFANRRAGGVDRHHTMVIRVIAGFRDRPAEVWGSAALATGRVTDLHDPRHVLFIPLVRC